MNANIAALYQQQYQELGALVAAAPDLLNFPLTRDQLAWLGRASVLVDAVSGPIDHAAFTVACDGLEPRVSRLRIANQILMIVHRALARAEARAPAAAQGGFLMAGAQFTAYRVVGRILGTATRQATIVDPYVNNVALFDFAPLAPEHVNVRLLGSNREQLAESLREGFRRWQAQYGAARPLEIRIADRRVVHDRLIEIDGDTVFTFTQSFKDLAARAHTTAVRVPPEIAEPKIEAYDAIWRDALPV